MQEAVTANAKVHKGRLNAGFEIDDPSFVDIANVVIRAGPFDIQFFEQTILDNGDAALLRLGDIDQHFVFHEAFSERASARQMEVGDASGGIQESLLAREAIAEKRAATMGLPANSAEGSPETNGAKRAGGFGASAGHLRPINCRMEILEECREQDLEPLGRDRLPLSTPAN
jgi:hypothetical protein